VFRIDKNPPVLGDNQIEVEIRDATGKPVKDAEVLINYLYAAHAQNGPDEL